MKKVLGLILLAAVVIGVVYGWMEYQRGATDARDMPAQETVSAAELLSAFQKDEAAATNRYVGTVEQVIQVNGTIRNIDQAGEGLANVILDTDDEFSGVVCEFSSNDLPKAWATGSTVSIKGICTGLLMDVVLVRCQAVE